MNFAELLEHKFLGGKYIVDNNLNEEITDYIELTGFSRKDGKGVSNPFEVF